MIAPSIYHWSQKSKSKSKVKVKVLSRANGAYGGAYLRFSSTRSHVGECSKSYSGGPVHWYISGGDEANKHKTMKISNMQKRKRTKMNCDPYLKIQGRWKENKFYIIMQGNEMNKDRTVSDIHEYQY